MSLVDKMLARKGISRADVAPTSRAGKAFRKGGVRRTDDFRRILNLPCRVWERDLEANGLVQLLSNEFRRPGSVATLLPQQAAGLNDLHDYGGLFGPMGVGSGKTLLSFLAPRVVASKRPLIMVPAKLRKKTERDWWRYSHDWVLPDVKIVTYEKLGVAKNADWLEEYNPDCIIADEAHKLKNTKAAVTKRVARFLRARPQQVKLGLISGTMTVRTLRDFWHLLRWTLGPTLMPLPVEWSEMMEWAECLDVESDRAVRNQPGALAEFCSTPFPTVEEARDGYRRRLTQTPGVVATSNREADCSLQVDELIVDLQHLSPLYQKMRQDWETPDGHPFEQASDLWRHARELVCGFYYVWDPRPPADWLIARREWSKFVREVLAHSRTYDTPFQVAQACSQGHLESIEYYHWKGIRDTFKPNTVPVWVDDTTLKVAAKWLETEGGIVWTEHPAFAERLSHYTGVPYFGRGGLSKDKVYIEEAGGKPAIASVLTAGEGMNLQFGWNKSLVVSCPPNGKTVEQLLGRMHRKGQPKDEVQYTFVSACYEQAVGLLAMEKDAEYIQGLMGQPQRLVYADREFSSVEDIVARGGPLWEKKR